MSGNETPTRGHIQINNVSKIYDPDGAKVLAVDRCTMDIAPGEFCVVVGPSGCGKTTLLNAIAGFHSISSGEILLDGEVLCSADKQAQPGSDRIVVFQNGALFPWFTVLENVTFGPIVQKAMRKEEAEDKAMEMLGQMGLMGIENNYPSEISSGMRRRVEIARAMMNTPRVLLLDEPLSNLDAKLRAQMRTEIAKLHKRLGTTFIYVTHDQTEAMTMGDRIVVMKDGFIQQVDTPQNLYDLPVNEFVAGFMGSPQMNFIDATLVKEGADYYVTFGAAKIKVPANKANAEIANYVGKEIVFGIRPEDVHDEPEFIEKHPEARATADVEVTELMGAETYLYLNCEGNALTARVEPTSTAKTGDKITIALDMNKMHLFDKETEKTILN